MNETREKVDADDVEALQIGCRPNWGELEKLRKLLEPARLKLIRSDGRRCGRLGVYIGAISPPLSLYYPFPSLSLSLSVSLSQSISARADWQGFAISVTRPVTNFDLHNWRNTLRDYREILRRIHFSFIILYFSFVQTLASHHFQRISCLIKRVKW